MGWFDGTNRLDHFQQAGQKVGTVLVMEDGLVVEVTKVFPDEDKVQVKILEGEEKLRLNMTFSGAWKDLSTIRATIEGWETLGKEDKNYCRQKKCYAIYDSKAAYDERITPFASQSKTGEEIMASVF